MVDKYTFLKKYFRKTRVKYSKQISIIVNLYGIIATTSCLFFSNLKYFNLVNSYFYIYYTGFWILFKIKSFFNLDRNSNLISILFFLIFSLLFLLLIFIHLIILTSDRYVDIYQIYSSPDMQNASHFDKFCKLYEDFKYWAFDPNFMTMQEKLQAKKDYLETLTNEFEDRKEFEKHYDNLLSFKKGFSKMLEDFINRK